MTQKDVSDFNLDEVLDWLKSKDIRVTRPFEPREFYSTESAPSR
jgi:hypothetical protein